MKIGYVYKITNPVGNTYVGSTIRLSRRKNAYKNANCKNQTKIYHSLLKYGWEAHSFEILWQGDFLEMYKREREIGLSFNVLDNKLGLNLKLPDDNGHPLLISPEVCKKISDKAKGRYVGEKNPFYGKKHNIDTKLKMSQNHKDITGTNNPNFGHKWTQEMKNDMRDKQKNIFRYFSPEYRDKVSQRMKGHKYSVGRKASEKTKTLMSNQRRRGLSAKARIIIDINTGVFYDCITDLAELYNVDRRKMNYIILKGKSNFKYA